jgi:hypothetical protein
MHPAFFPYLVGLIPIFLARTWFARWVAICFGCISLGLAYYMVWAIQTVHDNVQQTPHMNRAVLSALATAAVSLFLTYFVDRTTQRRMDKKEAYSVLGQQMATYRTRSYAVLAAWARDRRIDTPAAVAPSGKQYQVEVQFLWDNKPDGDVRVFGSIDDGGERVLVPLTDCFVVNPEGKFVGE